MMDFREPPPTKTELILRWSLYAFIAFMAVTMVVLIAYQPTCALPVLPGAVLIIVLIRHNFRMRINNQEPPWFTHPALWVFATWLAMFGLFMNLGGPEKVHWQESSNTLPEISQEDDQIHVRNIRDFDFFNTGDFDVRFLEEDFHPDRIAEVWMAVYRHPGDLNGSHVAFSFIFDDGRDLVIGELPRLPMGEKYEPLAAACKSYGLMWLLSTESDYFRLLTNYANADFAVYPLKINAAAARRLFIAAVKQAVEDNSSELAYDPVAASVGFTIPNLLQAAYPAFSAWHPQFNSGLPEKLYDMGLLRNKQGETWPEMQARCTIEMPLAAKNRSAYRTKLRERVQEAPLTDAAERNVILYQPKQRQELRNHSDAKEDSLLQRRFTSADEVPEPTDRLASEGRMEAIPRRGEDDEEAEEETVEETDVEAETGTKKETPNDAANEAANEAAIRLDNTAVTVSTVGGAPVAVEAEQKSESDGQTTAEQAKGQEQKSAAKAQKNQRKPEWVAPRKHVNPLDKKVAPKEDPNANPFDKKPISL